MDTGIAAAGGPMGEEEATPGQGDHWNPGSLQLQLRTVNHDGEMADIHTMAFSQGMGGSLQGPTRATTRNRYLVFPELKECCLCCNAENGCGILSATWLNGAEYQASTEEGGGAHPSGKAGGGERQVHPSA